MRALRRALEGGIRFFDTSDLYGSGHSEVLLGQALQAWGDRESVFLSTKAGYVDAAGAQDFSPQHLEESLHDSLRRLQCSYVDLFQLHDPPEEVLRDEALWKFLAGWRERGLVRHLGASVRRPADARLALERDAVQLNYSLIDQRARLDGTLDACQRRGQLVIARTPLAFGFLAGSQALSSEDHRLRFSPAQIERWEQARERFSALLQGPTAAVKALRFCLGTPGISVAIPGMLTVAQVEENLLVHLSADLTLEERTRVEDLYAELAF